MSNPNNGDKREKSPAFRWLNKILSETGPRSPTTRLVLCAVFRRVNWNTGKGCFESTRTIAKKTGLTKTCVAKHLLLAVKGGWLSQIPRAVRGNPNKSGYQYDIKFPSLLANPIGQGVASGNGQKSNRGKHFCPITKRYVAKHDFKCGHSGEQLCPNGMDQFPSDSPSSHLRYSERNAPCAGGAARAGVKKVWRDERRNPEGACP